MFYPGVPFGRYAHKEHKDKVSVGVAVVFLYTECVPYPYDLVTASILEVKLARSIQLEREKEEYLYCNIGKNVAIRSAPFHTTRPDLLFYMHPSSIHGSKFVILLIRVITSILKGGIPVGESLYIGSCHRVVVAYA